MCQVPRPFSEFRSRPHPERPIPTSLLLDTLQSQLSSRRLVRRQFHRSLRACATLDTEYEAGSVPCACLRFALELVPREEIAHPGLFNCHIRESRIVSIASFVGLSPPNWESVGRSGNPPSNFVVSYSFLLISPGSFPVAALKIFLNTIIGNSLDYSRLGRCFKGGFGGSQTEAGRTCGEHGDQEGSVRCCAVQLSDRPSRPKVQCPSSNKQ